jgi:hypothetical protein
MDVGMAVAFNFAMKLEMAMSHPIGAEESRRRQKILVHHGRELRDQARAELRRRIFCQTRAIFVFLLNAAILVFALSHLTKIDSVTAKKMHQTAVRIQTQAESSPLRQSALNHEREVDVIASR